MDVKLLEQSKDKLKAVFSVKGVDAAFVNTLRRAIVSKVPTMAVQEVEFTKNSSVLYDEMMAHRLGLIPLKTDLKSYKMPDEVAEGSAEAEVKLTLSVKADKLMVVHASEIKSKDPSVVPVFGNTPIVKLLKDQELEFVATAKLGTGQQHAKHTPALAHFYKKPEVTVTKAGESRTDLKDMCAPGVLDVKSGKLVINKDYAIDPKLFDAAVAASEGALTLKESNDEFIFVIESWGQLTCGEIMNAALGLLKKDNDEFVKLLKAA